MNKSNANLTFKGNPLAVAGAPLSEGMPLPGFRLTGTDLGDITNERFRGKVLILSVVPSLDTPVCALQTKRFNQEVERFKDAAVLTVSMDLPFAQKRWCGAENASHVVTASDYKYRNFGESFGILLKDLGLLGRAVFVADKQGKIAYVEYVQELSTEPDYTTILAKVKELA